MMSSSEVLYPVNFADIMGNYILAHTEGDWPQEQPPRSCILLIWALQRKPSIKVHLHVLL